MYDEFDFEITYEARDREEVEFYYLLTKQYFFYVGLHVGNIEYFDEKTSIETSENKKLNISYVGKVVRIEFLYYLIAWIYLLSKALSVKKCRGELKRYLTNNKEKMSYVGGEFVTELFTKESYKLRSAKTGFAKQILFLYMSEFLSDKEYRSFEDFDFEIRATEPSAPHENEHEKEINEAFVAYLNSLFSILERNKEKLLSKIDCARQEKYGYETMLMEAFENFYFENKNEILLSETKFKKSLDMAKRGFVFETSRAFETSRGEVVISWLRSKETQEVDMVHEFYKKIPAPKAPTIIDVLLKAFKNNRFGVAFPEMKEDIIPSFLSEHSSEGLFDYKNLFSENLSENLSRIELKKGVSIPLTPYFINLFSVPASVLKSNCNQQRKIKQEKTGVINLSETMLSTDVKDPHFPKLINNEAGNEMIKIGKKRISLCDICVNVIRKNTVGCNDCKDFGFRNI